MYRAEIYRTCDVHGPYNHVYWFWEAQLFEEFAGPAKGVIRRHIAEVRYNTYEEAISRTVTLLFALNGRLQTNAK